MSQYHLPVEKKWTLEISSGDQIEQILIVFDPVEKVEPSFWSFNLDWPDYLIIGMALVFAIICYIQYSSDEKIKNS